MRYRVGDEVIITKEGVHKGRKVTIKERNKIATKLTMNMQNYYYYTVTFYNNSSFVVNEEDIKPHKLIDCENREEDQCECGGDKLEIPHHYDWCPKGAKHEQ